MSQLVSRILLAIFVFPLASILYLVLFIAIEEGSRSSVYGNSRDREMVAFLIAGLVTWAGMALYWWLLWRSSPRGLLMWNDYRIPSATFNAGSVANLAFR